MASQHEEVAGISESSTLNVEQVGAVVTEKPSDGDSMSLGASLELDFVSFATNRLSMDDSGASQSEMEFDPENTPRDPVLPEETGVGINSANCVTDQVDEDDTIPITLDTIPAEILLYICHFLEAGVVINTLAKVCRKFRDLFNNEPYWRIRMKHRWPKKYPPLDCDDVDWQEACVERERTHRVWSDPDQYMDHFTFSEGLYASVDSVHLMENGRFLAGGSRDRYLTLLDLTRYDPSQPERKRDMLVQCVDKAHLGWIWSIASLDHRLYTGSWDTNIKVWDLENNLTVADTYRCRSAVLCLHVERNFIAAGGFDKKVCFIDPRQETPLAFKRWHRQPVLCLAADDDYIISGSEDKTFSVYDRRAGLVFKSVKIENYPMSVYYHKNQLWFGDRLGRLNLIDTTLGKFEVVQSYDVGHKEKMTGVIYTEGAIFTSSNDKSIKVLEPSLDPATTNTLVKHDSGVAEIAYQNGVLASAGCDISIGVWRPKNDWGWTS